jgi:4-amino-4-deoxy-L-arabinose transferase-like glycosyltransferase
MQVVNTLSKLSIVSICLLALTLRAIWALLVPVEPVSDSFLYNVFAQNIASGKGYAFPDGGLTVYWPVGTSAVYATLYHLFGVSFLPIVLFNLVIGTAIVWLTYTIALRYLGKPVATFSALIVACWPILIQFTTILASELIFIFLILAAIYVWGSKQSSPILRALVWGALICAATYIRPTALPLLLLLPLLSWLSGLTFKQSLAQLTIAVATAAILFAPWVYRNHVLFNQFVLVSANGGANLWMGNNPLSNGGYMDLPNIEFKNEVARDKYFKKEAINFILNNPLSYLKLMCKRAITTYKSETIGVVWNGALEKELSKTSLFILKLFSTVYWWCIIMASLMGVYELYKRRSLVWHHALFAVTAFFFAFPILTVAQDRYHLPINPFLAIFAAYALDQRFRSNTNFKYIQ